MDKLFFIAVTQKTQIEPNQDFIVGSFEVASVREATWLERILFRIKKSCSSKGQYNNTASDTNATIGIKIAGPFYSKLLGLVRRHTGCQDTELKFVPAANKSISFAPNGITRD